MIKLSKNAQAVYDTIVAIEPDTLRICSIVSIEADTGISASRLRGYITHLKKVGLIEEKVVWPDLQIIPT